MKPTPTGGVQLRDGRRLHINRPASREGDDRRLHQNTQLQRASDFAPTALDPHQPRFVPLTLAFQQSTHPVCVGAAEHDALWQYLFANPAPAVAAGVDDRIA
jgi:hypothetical protein